MRNEATASPSHEPSAELEPEVRIAQQTGVAFLHTELQLAEAFLDIAETTTNAATCHRNLGNTDRALVAVGRFIERLPELPQRQELALRAAGLRKRLWDTQLRLRSGDRFE